MRELLRAVMALPEAQEAAGCLEAGKSPVAITGLAPIHRAHMAAALAMELHRPLVMLCSDETEANRMASDLAILTGETAV